MTVDELTTKLKLVLPEGFRLRVLGDPDEVEVIVSHGSRRLSAKAPVTHNVTDEQAEDIIHEVEDFVRVEGH